MRETSRVGLEQGSDDQSSVRVEAGLHFEKKLVPLAGGKTS